MILKTNGMWAILWGLLRGIRPSEVAGEVPRDICSLTWGTLLYIVLLPFSILAIPFSLIVGGSDNKNWFIPLVGIVIIVMSLTMGSAYAPHVDGDVVWGGFFPLLKYTIFGYLSWSAIIGIVVGIYYIIKAIQDSKWNKNRIKAKQIRRQTQDYQEVVIKPTKFSIVWTMIKSFKEKHCTIIDWE